MSILKGILHHWNKTTKSYDTIHPETESAQITDWHQGIVNTLASTALGTLVNTLTSDSLLASMIQKVLTATGVKYSMGQNGYICFGSLFGGLIIQWGNFKGATTQTQAFPITFSEIFNLQLWQYDEVEYQYSAVTNNITFTVNSVTHSSSLTAIRYWLAIGY